MKLLFNKLKGYWKLILLIIAVLFVQAFAELTLPDYMARIVNIGISQNGIENQVPLVISKDTFERLVLVNETNKDNVDLIKSNYSFKENFSGNNSGILKNASLKDVYILNDENKNNDSKLSDVISKGLFTIEYLSGKIDTSMMNGLNVPKASVNFDSLMKMQQGMRSKVLEEVSRGMDKIPQQVLKQGGIRLIKNEYEKVGLDTNKIQNNYLIKSGVKMASIALVALFATLLAGFIASRVAADFGKNLRKETFRKVLTFSNVEFDKFSTASLITRSNNDIQQVQNMLVMLLRMLFFAPIMGIGGLIKSLNYNMSMAWVIGFAILLILGFIALLFTFAIPMFTRIQKLIDKLQLVTREILNGVLIIRAFVTGKHEEKRFDATNKDIIKLNQKIANTMNLMQPVLMIIMNVVSLLIVWVGANEISKSNIMVGDLMAFLQYGMLILMSFVMISMVSLMLPRAQITLKRVNEVLEVESSIKEIENPVKLPAHINGKIEFKNVNYRFPKAPIDALSDINLTINPGEVTAIIGSTGSGKTSLVNLIPRFIDATMGEVLIDGINVKNMSLEDLRNKIGYVPQKSNLFSGDILSNMRIGKNSEITEDRVSEAINIAQAEEFVSKLEEGLSHEITQGGTNVSGGQKQRLSIARAIVGKPDIYIFDDSFSALDFKTDLDLRRALFNESKDKTVVIITQRIGTIINADKIVVLDEGRIVGVGKHTELLKNNEVYKEIASSQLSKEVISDAK